MTAIGIIFLATQMYIQKYRILLGILVRISLKVGNTERGSQPGTGTRTRWHPRTAISDRESGSTNRSRHIRTARSISVPRAPAVIGLLLDGQSQCGEVNRVQNRPMKSQKFLRPAELFVHRTSACLPLRRKKGFTALVSLLKGAFRCDHRAGADV